MPSPTAHPLIGIDWGSTHCRAFRFTSDGSVAETRQAHSGVGTLRRDEFAAALERLIGDWLAADASTSILLCGMVGSRQGWLEAPYVSAPADAESIAQHLQPLSGLSRRTAIVPGLSINSPNSMDTGDIMRGEETQLIGCMKQGCPELIVAPGTHSKWVWVSSERIEHFATYMTGEVFAVLREHSLIGKIMTEGAWDAEAFQLGVSVARNRPDWLHQLFSVRVRGILGDMAPASLPAYLSGLLIGYEIGAALSHQPPPASIRVIGSEQLARHYTAALRAFGLDTQQIDGDAAVSRGLWKLAVAAGWMK